jgi:hypothetical protein
VSKDEIENLFKCLDVDSIIELFACLLLEKKVLLFSKHKALLTQVMNCFVSFLFPFQWKHTMIPILPMTMIDILDAPFPYFVGLEPNPNMDNYDLEQDVVRVDLDEGIIALPTDMLM